MNAAATASATPAGRNPATAGLGAAARRDLRGKDDLAINQTEIRLTLETRDPSHRGEVVQAMNAAGFDAREWS